MYVVFLLRLNETRFFLTISTDLADLKTARKVSVTSHTIPCAVVPMALMLLGLMDNEYFEVFGNSCALIHGATTDVLCVIASVLFGSRLFSSLSFLKLTQQSAFVVTRL